MTHDELKLLFREFIMRGKFAFPQDSQDLKWWDEGMKEQHGLYLRMEEALELGKLNEDELAALDKEIDYDEPDLPEKILKRIRENENRSLN